MSWTLPALACYIICRLRNTLGPQPPTNFLLFSTACMALLFGYRCGMGSMGWVVGGGGALRNL